MTWVRVGDKRLCKRHNKREVIPNVHTNTILKDTTGSPVTSRIKKKLEKKEKIEDKTITDNQIEVRVTKTSR